MANRDRRNLALQSRNQRLAALCALVAFGIVVGATIAARFRPPTRSAAPRSAAQPAVTGNSPGSNIPFAGTGLKQIAAFGNQEWAAANRTGRLAQRGRNTSAFGSPAAGTRTGTRPSGNFATESGNAPVLSRRSSTDPKSLGLNDPIPGRW